MSHTSTINSVVIADKHAVTAAIAELKANGVNCELLENAKPRAYYSNQSGMGEAEMVINLKDSRYDVGLYKNEQGTYEARCDLWGGDIAKNLGVPATGDTPREQAALGKFFSTYAAHAAQRKAIQQGYSVRRINNKDGSIQLQINT
jgi:hypothetical protein